MPRPARMLALAALVASVASADDFKVNGELIPQGRVDFVVEELISRGGMPSTPDLKKEVREKLIITEIFAQNAMKQGLDKSPRFQQQVEHMKRNLLARTYVNDYQTKHPISENDLRKEYDKVKPQLDQEVAQQEKIYKTRHILVPTEQKAKELISKLKKGSDFSELAKKNSTDPGSAQNGGLLENVRPSQLTKPFSEAMVKLPKGKMTQEPVKSEFGYHIILVEDIQTPKKPTFEDLKPQLTQMLQQKQLTQLEIDARASAKVDPPN